MWNDFICPHCGHCTCYMGSHADKADVSEGTDPWKNTGVLRRIMIDRDAIIAYVVKSSGGGGGRKPIECEYRMSSPADLMFACGLDLTAPTFIRRSQ